jgi:hypothetical protein
MVRKILVLSVLAMSLAAPSTYAQTAPASAVDPASIQALKDMGAFLQTLKRFRVSTELTGERVLADGQKLQHTATADMDVERPNKIRALMRSARSERELVYDGKTVTLYTPAQKYYSTVEFTDTIGKLIERLEERYGVELPLADFFLCISPANRSFMRLNIVAIVAVSRPKYPATSFNRYPIRRTKHIGNLLAPSIPPNSGPLRAAPRLQYPNIYPGFLRPWRSGSLLSAAAPPHRFRLPWIRQTPEHSALIEAKK